MYPQSKREVRNCKIIKTVFACCKEFFMQTSIHGLNHIAAPRRHWAERIVWVFITAMAVWGVVDISLGQWQRYNDNPTVVTLEKDFRTWRFNIPALTACEQDRVSMEKVPNAIKSRWNIGEEDQKYEYYHRFIKTVANSDLFHLNGYAEFKDDATLNVNLYELAVEVLPEHRIKMGSSETLLQKWIPIMTEAGACYTINSIAVADVALVKPDKNNTLQAPTTCKYSSQSCYIMVESAAKIDYYIHSPYDVANVMVTPSTVYPSLNRYTELSSMETRTGLGVRELPPKTRHCLYTDEPVKPSRKVYSTHTCRQDCRSRLAQKLCGCKPFYYFYDDGPSCTPSGMWCLAAYSQTLANFGGIKCACSQQCLGSVFREISKEDQIWDRGPFQARGAVRFTVQAPRTRYTRHIVFHLQDLVVSFGGAAGLFLGASFISFVEIGYFLLEKLFRGPPTNTKMVQKPTIPYDETVKEITCILEENFNKR
ncbi:unnamed protein product, partial [Brenthis ino]